VEQLRRQDAGAAEALVGAYSDRVYRLAIRITGNVSDAEEVVQDALWTASRKTDSFRGAGLAKVIGSSTVTATVPRKCAFCEARLWSRPGSIVLAAGR